MEVLVATTVFVAGVVSLVQILAAVTASNMSARYVTQATVLAAQKLEELRALTQSSDDAGLAESPADSLRENTAGYVDYVDRFGRSLGGGASPPDGALYIRRWSVVPVPAHPENAVVIHVLVTRHTGNERLTEAGAGLGDVRLLTVSARRAR
jgi:hypothetical protein